MQTEPQSISGTPSEIKPPPAVDGFGVEVGTELDIATAIVYLQARAKRFGTDAIPTEVQLAPNAPMQGWVAAAKRFVKERKEAAQNGQHFNARD